ncbi:Hydroxyacylglutathione hydrolase GloC [Planctomycetales bacterium 10988]|nr:Hydroxyacylglutathione hydrolase GloC [Planctomycetales bacterium 10988]
MFASLDCQIETIVSPPFQENTFILSLPDRSDCLIVDPGFLGEPIFHYLQEKNLTPAAILNTHGHADHIAGNDQLKQAFPDCPLIIGEIDAPMLTDPGLNLSAMFGFELLSPPADRTLKDGDTLNLAGFHLKVDLVPGHSPGHVTFYWQEGKNRLLINGDVLFFEGIGRSDFPGGSETQLKSGIRERLYKLPDDTIVLTGHGEPTTIGHEKENNPFVRP